MSQKSYSECSRHYTVTTNPPHQPHHPHKAAEHRSGNQGAPQNPDSMPPHTKGTRGQLLPPSPQAGSRKRDESVFPAIRSLTTPHAVHDGRPPHVAGQTPEPIQRSRQRTTGNTAPIHSPEGGDQPPSFLATLLRLRPITSPTFDRSRRTGLQVLPTFMT